MYLQILRILEICLRQIIDGQVAEMATKAKSENVYAACRDGDHVYVRDWVLSAENDVNQG